MSSSRPGLLGRLETRLRGVFSELAKFGTVGAMSFVIDVTVFNAVLLVLDKPLTAKVISTVFSATNAFVLNRAWSFKHRERTNVAANGVGLVLGTTFRFWSYRRFVWAAPTAVEDAADEGDAAARAVLEDVADGTIVRP